MWRYRVGNPKVGHCGLSSYGLGSQNQHKMIILPILTNMMSECLPPYASLVPTLQSGLMKIHLQNERFVTSQTSLLINYQSVENSASIDAILMLSYPCSLAVLITQKCVPCTFTRVKSGGVKYPWSIVITKIRSSRNGPFSCFGSLGTLVHRLDMAECISSILDTHNLYANYYI